MICDLKGRDCIEKNSSKTFNCNTTCVGIYADVEWVQKDIEVEVNEGKSQETMKAELEGKIHDDLKKGRKGTNIWSAMKSKCQSPVKIRTRDGNLALQ